MRLNEIEIAISEPPLINRPENLKFVNGCFISDVIPKIQVTEKPKFDTVKKDVDKITGAVEWEVVNKQPIDNRVLTAYMIDRLKSSGYDIVVAVELYKLYHNGGLKRVKEYFSAFDRLLK